MTGVEIPAVEPARRAWLDGEDTAAAAVGLTRILSLAATPTFLVMGLLTGLGGSPIGGLCGSLPGAPLSGMVPMYLLMSAFHSPAWLRLILGRPGVSAGNYRATTTRRGGIGCEGEAAGKPRHRRRETCPA
jgi:hypothetical protein